MFHYHANHRVSDRSLEKASHTLVARRDLSYEQPPSSSLSLPCVGCWRDLRQQVCRPVFPESARSQIDRSVLHVEQPRLRIELRLRDLQEPAGPRMSANVLEP